MIQTTKNAAGSPSLNGTGSDTAWPWTDTDLTAGELTPAVWELGDRVRVDINRLVKGRAYTFHAGDVQLVLVKRIDGALDVYYLPPGE